MKKLLSILLILAMLIPAASLAAGGLVGPGKMYVYTSNGKSLNVRSEPRTGDNIIGHLKYGAEVNVVEFYNGWTEISWGDTTAYLQSRFLQWYVPGPKPQPEPTEDPEKEEKEKLKKEQASEKDIDPIMLQVNATRSTGWINIRSVPSKLGKRIESCADGTLLQADGETDKWYRVTDQMTGKSGYIFKMYTTVMPKPEPVTLETEAEIGKLNVNGEFDLQCRIPEGYKLQVISSQGGKIIATLTTDDTAKPQMLLTVAFDEMYADVDRMNDMSDEDIETIKKSYTDLGKVEFSDAETGKGTRMLVAREVGADEDFVSFFSVYKGYTVEFVLTPNPAAAEQVITDDQIQTSIDFLTDLDFVPAA